MRGVERCVDAVSCGTRHVRWRTGASISALQLGSAYELSMLEEDSYATVVAFG